jgi:hypothetical protein
MVCANCGAEARADNGTCVACGAVRDLDTRPDLNARGPVQDVQRVGVAAAPSEQLAVTAVAAPVRTRVPWKTFTIAIVALVVVALIAGLAVSRRSLAATLETTRTALGTANDQLGDVRTQLEGLKTQLAGAQSQLDDAHAANRDVQVSLTACQDLFRMGASNGNRTPSGPEKAKAASLLVSCFQGELPSLFP